MDIIEAKIDYLVLISNGMANIQGVVPSALHGYVPPPPPRDSPTPSIQSLSTRSLSVVDSPSNPSSRSSSLSERKKTGRTCTGHIMWNSAHLIRRTSQPMWYELQFA